MWCSLQKNGYQNRCQIKTPKGKAWLTEPVRTKGRFGQSTRDVEFYNAIDWRKKHLKSLEVNYRKAKYFDTYYPPLSELYLSRDWTHLTSFNTALITLLCSQLGLRRRFELASNLKAIGTKTDLLIDICKKVDGTVYLSGTGGAQYQDEKAFAKYDLTLSYLDFCHGRYPQLWGPFLKGVSIVDLLFNCGPHSLEVLTGSYISPRTA